MRSACQLRRWEYQHETLARAVSISIERDESRMAAADASLANVQKKHSEAEATWRAMADLATLRNAGGLSTVNVMYGSAANLVLLAMESQQAMQLRLYVSDSVGERRSTKRA